MIRAKVLSALSALTVAAASAASTAPAAAFSSFNVSFVMNNTDLSNSMIRTSSLPSGVSGLPDPATEVTAGSSDPSTGHATWSLPYPGVGQSSEATLVYALYTSHGNSVCTFKIKVTRTATSSFTLHFSTSDATRCPVPGDATSTDGQFNGTPYGLNWKS